MGIQELRLQYYTRSKSLEAVVKQQHVNYVGLDGPSLAVRWLHQRLLQLQRR